MASSSESKTALARKLNVSRSSLYYKHKVPEKDEELRVAIEKVHRQHPGYGYRRVALELGINAKRAQRVMRKFKLRPPRRSKVPKKKGDIGKEPSKRVDITSLWCPIEPDLIWVSDFTYIYFHGRFLYLATVLDLFTGEVLGFNISDRHDSELVLKAMQRAKGAVDTVPQWFHSDQGSEFCSDEATNWLVAHGINISHSPKSSPWRNASQESFYGRYKVEFGDFERFDTVSELVEEIYSKLYYFSEMRIKNRLKMSPAEYRRKWINDTETIKKKLGLAPAPTSSWLPNRQEEGFNTAPDV